MLEGYANEESLRELASEVNDFWCCGGSIDRIDAPQSMQDVILFLREYVSTRRPCIIRNAFPHDDDRIPNILTLDDILLHNNNNNHDCTIVVDVTPDGHGDCIHHVKDTTTMDCNKKMFVKPMQVSMTITQFTESLRNGRNKQQLLTNNHYYDSIETTIFPIMEQQQQPQKMTSKSEEEEEIRREEQPWNIHNNDDAVLYYSRQNDCLRNELQELIPSYMYPSSFSWAELAFGTGPPDAINIWIGDERAVSSMHKDPYENLFYVWSGEKIFTLCPPSDILFLQENKYPSATFHYNYNNNNHPNTTTTNNQTQNQQSSSSYSWYVKPDYDSDNDDDDDNQEGNLDHPKNTNCLVQWIETDVEGILSSPRNHCEPETNVDNNNTSPLSSSIISNYINPIRVSVKQGEMLYLPSLWLHRVTQTCETIGINYWYDMKFEGPNWTLFQFLQQIKLKHKV